MNYTIEWVPSAENDLAALWLNVELRPLLAKAANAIDVRLRWDAHEVGESRERRERIEFEPPFAVIFECDPTARHVKVLYIWAF